MMDSSMFIPVVIDFAIAYSLVKIIKFIKWKLFKK